MLVTDPVPATRLHTVLSVGMNTPPDDQLASAFKTLNLSESALSWPLDPVTKDAYIKLNPEMLAAKLIDNGYISVPLSSCLMKITASSVAQFIYIYAQSDGASESYPGYCEWVKKHYDSIQEVMTLKVY